MLTKELLRNRYSYDPETGLLTNNYTLSPKAVKGAVAGCRENNGYLTIRINKRQYSLHRAIWLYVHGVIPKGTIDHINRIRDDNRLCNLRDVPHSINTHNKDISGIKGYKITPSNRFIASITDNNTQVYLGTYDTPEEANAAYLTYKERLLP